MSTTFPNGAAPPPIPPAPSGRLHLKKFHESNASIVADWVQTPEQLKRLAPGSTMPLTAEKVLGWRRPQGHVLQLTPDGAIAPIGYAELNPMQRERGHLWLGHVIVCPTERGRGIGTVFVRMLLEYAFDQLAAHRVSLIVYPDNKPAVACYQRVGFKPTREEYHAFGASKVEERMLRLEIRPPLPKT
ncbi:MAG: N-acetyltransferase [Planctomycetes bacterium]|nr:N-acetyltransferase [Planctomycetota bacterium]